MAILQKEGDKLTGLHTYMNVAHIDISCRHIGQWRLESCGNIVAHCHATFDPFFALIQRVEGTVDFLEGEKVVDFTLTKSVVYDFAALMQFTEKVKYGIEGIFICLEAKTLNEKFSEILVSLQR